MKITARERKLAAQCKYLEGGNVSWLAKKLKCSRIRAYVVLAKHYLEITD